MWGFNWSCLFDFVVKLWRRHFIKWLKLMFVCFSSVELLWSAWSYFVFKSWNDNSTSFFHIHETESAEIKCCNFMEKLIRERSVKRGIFLFSVCVEFLRKSWFSQFVVLLFILAYDLQPPTWNIGEWFRYSFTRTLKLYNFVWFLFSF